MVGAIDAGLTAMGASYEALGALANRRGGRARQLVAAHVIPPHRTL
jgi:hypothetical protein